AVSKFKSARSRRPVLRSPDPIGTEGGREEAEISEKDQPSASLPRRLPIICHSLLPQPPPPVSKFQLPDQGPLLMPVNSSRHVMPHAEARGARAPKRRSP